MAKSAPPKAPRKPPAAWRVDGISPAAVARASHAAERAGLPLAEWLSRVIRETAARERQEQAAPRDPSAQS